MAPIFLRNSLQLGTYAKSAFRAAWLRWCYSSRNFRATPTVSAGNGTGADFAEAFPAAANREGACVLTLRANEVGTQRALSTQTTLSSKVGDRHWLMRTGTLSAKRSTMELNGKNGKSCIATAEKWVRQQELKSPVNVKKRKLCGQ